MIVLDVKTVLEEMGGDKDIYSEVLEVFLEDIPGILENLEKSIKEYAIEDTHRHAHSIKGAARTVGAMIMFETARQFEEEAKAGDLSKAEFYLLQLDKEFKQVQAEAEKLD